MRYFFIKLLDILYLGTHIKFTVIIISRHSLNFIIVKSSDRNYYSQKMNLNMNLNNKNVLKLYFVSQFLLLVSYVFCAIIINSTKKVNPFILQSKWKIFSGLWQRFWCQHFSNFPISMYLKIPKKKKIIYILYILFKTEIIF